ncbi:MAG: ATP synthase subunit I [Pseudomonadota bacterium]|nr:MAG: ATP synthase subunit I [Pseudomonadota bacterium]
MSVAAEVLHRSVRRVVVVQIIIAAAVAAAFFLASDWHDVLAALYGGAITVFASWWLGRQVRRADVTPSATGMGGKLAIYAMASVRFVVVLGLLALGIGGLELAAPALIIGFSTAKLGFFATLLSA